MACRCGTSQVSTIFHSVEIELADATWGLQTGLFCVGWFRLRLFSSSSTLTGGIRVSIHLYWRRSAATHLIPSSWAKFSIYAWQRTDHGNLRTGFARAACKNFCKLIWKSFFDIDNTHNLVSLRGCRSRTGLFCI